MKLHRSLQPFKDFICEVSDERKDGDGYWVYLAKGWRDPEGETHCIHEETPSECAKEMKHIVRCNEPGCCD